MARMYPERLPADVESEAERRLFHQFQSDFSDDFTVFHGVCWLSKRRGAGAFDGEADFIVAHPRHGVLVLEVKGGGVGYDAATGDWCSIDRRGEKHAIKNPVQQARTSHHVLQRMLHESEATRPYAYPFGHAMVFPDTRFDAPPSIDLAPEILIDMERIRELKQSVIDAFRFYRAGEPDPGVNAIDALTSVLGQSWQMPPMLGASIDAGELRTQQLTEQQYHVLNILGRRPRALISGAAGTGKTMLALEKARRLSRFDFRVLFTCFNKNLAAWAQRQLAGTTVEARNFHSVCTEIARRTGTLVERQPDEPENAFYERLPDLLMSAAERLTEKYDAIVVDEGQDFDELWWMALLELLEDPANGILYIFYDDNQRIYGQHGEFPIKDVPFELDENCRNTRAIHELVMLFYHGETQPTCEGPAGQRIELIDLPEGSDERMVVASHVSSLLQEGVRPQDIVILTPRSQQRSAWHLGSGAAWRLSWDLSSSDAVICSTIHAFKGLERPVVIVTELAGVDPAERAELLYVAFSRARQYLAVAGLNLEALAELQLEKPQPAAD